MKIHCKFNQYGADTGRMSSSDPNLQNIPSHNKDIRKMFVASNQQYYVDAEDSIEVSAFVEVRTSEGWKYASSVTIGDTLILEDSGNDIAVIVSRIDKLIDKNALIYYYK